MSLLLLGAKVVDLRSGTITVDGRLVGELSDREVALVGFLYEHPNEEISRATLLTEVFGYSPKANTRTVDMTVRRVRAKLEEDSSKPVFLLTVYGVGYRLDLPSLHGTTADRVEESDPLTEAWPAGRVWLRVPFGVGDAIIASRLRGAGHRVLCRPPVAATHRLSGPVTVIASEAAPADWVPSTWPVVSDEAAWVSLGVDPEEHEALGLIDFAQGREEVLAWLRGWLQTLSVEDVAKKMQAEQLAEVGLTDWLDEQLALEWEPEEASALASLLCRHRPARTVDLGIERSVLQSFARRGWVVIDRGRVGLCPVFRQIARARVNSTLIREARRSLVETLDTSVEQACSSAELSEVLECVGAEPPAHLLPRLWQLLQFCGSPSKRREVIQPLLKARRIPSSLLPSVLYFLAWDEGDRADRRSALESVVKQAAAVGDTTILRSAQINLLALSADDEPLSVVFDAVDELVETAHRDEDPRGLAWVHRTASRMVNRHLSSPDRARSHGLRGLKALARRDCGRARTELHYSLGISALRSGERERGLEHLEAAFESASTVGYERFLHVLTEALGWAYLGNEHERALAYFETATQSLAQRRRRERISPLSGLGWAQLALGQDADAHISFRRSCRTAERVGDPRGQALAHAAVAVVALLGGRQERASTAFELGTAIALNVVEDYVPFCERARAILSGEMAEADVQSPWERAMFVRANRAATHP